MLAPLNDPAFLYKQKWIKHSRVGLTYFNFIFLHSLLSILDVTVF